jgi:hypothetical protein
MFMPIAKRNNGNEGGSSHPMTWPQSAFKIIIALKRLARLK